MYVLCSAQAPMVIVSRRGKRAINISHNQDWNKWSVHIVSLLQRSLGSNRKIMSSALSNLLGSLYALIAGARSSTTANFGAIERLFAIIDSRYLIIKTDPLQWGSNLFIFSCLASRLLYMYYVCPHFCFSSNLATRINGSQISLHLSHQVDRCSLTVTETTRNRRIVWRHLLSIAGTTPLFSHSEGNANCLVTISLVYM